MLMKRERHKVLLSSLSLAASVFHELIIDFMAANKEERITMQFSFIY
jgi:hypothetical protein